MTRVRATGRTPSGPPIRTRLAPRGPRRRLAGMLAFSLLGLGILAGRLVQVQVFDAARYADRSVAQRVRTVDLPATRGRIYDRNGDVLATSVDSATIYADPRAYRPRPGPDGDLAPKMTADEVARRLGALLDVDVKALQDRLSSDSRFVYVARQLDWDVGQQVLDLKLPGIGRLVEPRRQYPAGTLASQVIGFTDIDGRGLEGLESADDDRLAGTAGQLAVEQAPTGLTIASGLRELTPAQPGTDLVLTLDREIQSVAEQAAANAVKVHDARGASIVVLDVHSGEILAMANAPSFDPTDRGATDRANRRNRAVTDVFEPGSVEKAVTVAAAIEEGVVTPSTTFTVSDTIRIGGSTFSDSHRHPTERMTVQQIVEQSSNVGTMMIAQELGAQRLYDYLQAFRYTQPTQVGVPGETGGLLPALDDWSGTSLPTIAMGQGVAITLLRAATSYATLANDGVAVQPRLVRGTVGTDGTLVPTPVETGPQVVSSATARSMREILRSVVDGQDGTGREAAVEGYDVGGKTGTAMKPRADGRGYSDTYVAGFVGMAPLDDPELVVAVMVDEPATGYYGGTAAAPAFADVMRFALQARDVAPSTNTTTVQQALDQAVAAGHVATGPDRSSTPTAVDESGP